MAERAKHLFLFKANQIADAAKEEAKYHAVRAGWWKIEFDKSLEVVKSTAKIIVREFGITGGTRVDLVIDYGDTSALSRMQEAAEKIKNDVTIAQLDPAYKSNASFDFQVIKGAPITRDDKLNKALWELPEGGVTEVFVGPAKDGSTGQYVDAVYHFGQVSKKVSSDITGFDDWLAGLRKRYAVKYY